MSPAAPVARAGRVIDAVRNGQAGSNATEEAGMSDTGAPGSDEPAGGTDADPSDVDDRTDLAYDVTLAEAEDEVGLGGDEPDPGGPDLNR